MKKEEVIAKIIKSISASEEEAEVIFEKALIGGEITGSLEDWLTQRFLPNVVMIDEKGYSQMFVDALKIVGTTAPTDYGGSRQRDLGQLWADMTRGYLGELAFKLFLEKNWNIKVDLGHEKGEMAKYLPTDIHTIEKPGEEKRKPKIKVSIKATKWNGIWLDIPGDQFSHSDIHVLVKLGTGRDHLFAFFKKISVFKDKVLKIGQEIGSLTGKEADELYDRLPTFRPIPAYICGFVPRDSKYKPLSYAGKSGKKHFTITEWNGPIEPGDLAKIKEKEGIAGNVKFQGIGEFAHEKGHLFNTGNLLYSRKDWDGIIKKA